MKAAAVEPDDHTYNALISVCSQGGQVETSMKLFDEMKEAGLCANTRTYSALMKGARLMG